MSGEVTPRLSRIAIYPIKSLDPVERRRTELIERGALAGDREFAIRDTDGGYVNGKRTADVHRLRTAFDEELTEVRLRVEGAGTGAGNGIDEGQSFSLVGDRDPLERRLSEFFGYPVTVDREPGGGFPDDTAASGPTVVSTATLREVASWFPGIDIDGMRRRLRANLEVDGVPPFWEDRLYANREHTVAFTIGDVAFEGVNPCQRCVVPSRDPDTGEEYEDFKETFIERREETLPDWANEAWYEHFFRLMVNMRVPEPGWGEGIAVGEEVRVLGERPLETTG